MNFTRIARAQGCLLLLLAAFALPRHAGAQVVSPRTFTSETWDTGTPPTNWPCKTAPSSCSSGALFHGWENVGADWCTNHSWMASSGVSTARAHSGTKSFYLNRTAGQTDSCDIQFALPSPYPTAINIRFYLYLDSNYLSFNTPTSREPFQHFLFTNSALSGTGFRVNLLSKVPYTSPHGCGAGENYPNQPYMFFNCENNSTQCSAGSPAGCYNLLAHLGEWQCVEFRFDAAAKKYNVWMGGTKVVDNASVPMSQSNFTMVQLSQFMSSEDGAGFATSFYIDDIAISDGYIGCGPTGSISPPLNLRF